MIPEELRLEGFLSYLRPARLDFQCFDLACISGPNGAGKSSLLDAMTWALFGVARRRDEGIIHNQADLARVEFVFQHRGARYRVQRARVRGRSQELELHQWDAQAQRWRPLTERRVRDTQARLEDLLQMDYRTFVHASFFLQGQADNFARATPSARKEILARILDLEVWQRCAERARERRREAEQTLSQLAQAIAAAREVLEQEPRYRQRLAEVEQGLRDLAEQLAQQEALLRVAEQHQSLLEELEAQWRTAQAQAQQAQQRAQAAQAQVEQLTRELAQLEAILAQRDAIQAQYAQYQARKAQLAEWEAKAQRYRELWEAAQQLEAQYREAQARLEEARRQLRQQLQRYETLQARVAAWADQKRQLEAELHALEEQLAALQDLDARRDELLQEKAQLETRNRALKAEMDRLAQRRDQLRAATATCPLCGQALSEDHRAQVLAQIEAEGRALAEEYRQNQARLKAIREALQTLAQALAEREGLTRRVQALRGQWERVQAQIEQAQAELAAAADLQRELHEVEAQLASGAFAPDVRAALAQKQAELAALGYDAAQHAALREAVQALAEVEQAYQTLLQAQVRAAELQQRVADWQQRAREAEAEEQRWQRELAALDEKRRGLTAQGPDLDTVRQHWLHLREQEARLLQERGALQQHLDYIAQVRQDLEAYQAQEQATRARIQQYREIEQACSRNGVPALLVEQALPQIEAETNRLLDRLTGGELSVRFATQKPYKTRKDLKETLEIFISTPDGERPFETLSGGEAFRVSFAIRVALARFLAHRAGAPLEMLVIDEGFGSQDADGRQRLIEAINAVRSQFAKILVITHIEDLKERFPVRIEVEKDDQGSRLRLVGAGMC
ncbi:MAG: SMC family ATPase [Chloroflexi bacterium]|nr:SMC family ATPase [Chloroflexota bacterium]